MIKEDRKPDMNNDSYGPYIQAIWDLTETLQNEKQTESALALCINTLVDVTGAERGLAWLQNKNDGRLYVMACTGQSDVTGLSFPANVGIPGRAFAGRKPETVNDVREDPDFSRQEYEDVGIEVKNTLIIPLLTRNSCYGCLQLINKEGGFTDEDLALGGHLSAIVALDFEDRGISIAPRTDKKPIIVMKNVIKEYPSGEDTIMVLKGVDLTIYEKEFLVILGESGCGKTTLLNIIGGMDTMTDGRMMVEDKDFSDPGDRQLTRYRRDYIGFVFQNYNLMPNLTALENIRLIAENSKNPMSPGKALEMVHLLDRKNNLPAKMSGGQQQRVSIARALVKNPKLILADEPTAALDYKTSIEVLAVMEEVIRSNNMTVVMITHNSEIAKMADRVVRIREGLISSIRINNSPLHAGELSW